MNAVADGEFWEVWSGSRTIAVFAMPSIPNHKANGLLPPFLGEDPGMSSTLMSPYHCTPAEVVGKFGTSAARRRILGGFLSHRQAMRSVGITSGIQWLAGSFVEVMSREPRDIDIVTFYVAPPGWNEDAVVEANRPLFDPRIAKREYHCDPYFICLNRSPEDRGVMRPTISRIRRGTRQDVRSSTRGKISGEQQSITSGLGLQSRRRVQAVGGSSEGSHATDVVKLTSFWCGLFSHQRDSYEWRGIVSVLIASNDDADAREMLELMEQYAPGGDA